MSLASPASLASTHWFLFVVVTAFIATLLWVAVYFLGVREVLNLAVNWILTVNAYSLINQFLINVMKVNVKKERDKKCNKLNQVLLN